ncbi:hypothetical protein ACE198_22415 [Neobacillus sp. KR4-4]|uniref:hypothetical protein n=1 Tax=Neobacillus sp. KR4-4 TaxID=3344872 RepID=UPI0035CAC4EB
MRETISVKEAVARLLETETSGKSLLRPERSIRLMLQKGMIEGIPPTKKNDIWKVYKDSLEDYIKYKKIYANKPRKKLLIPSAHEWSIEVSIANIFERLKNESIENIAGSLGTSKETLEAKLKKLGYICNQDTKVYDYIYEGDEPRNAVITLEIEITSYEVDKILLLINHIREKDGYEKISSDGLNRLSNYINEDLTSPLDALFVTDKMDKRLDFLCSKKTRSHNGQIVRIVGLCLALKFQIKIDYSVAIEILKDTFHNRRSLSKLNSEEINSCFEIMYWVTKVLYHFITDGNDFLKELDRKVFVERKSWAASEGSNVFLYLIAILLDNKKNTWKEISIITADQLREYYLRTPIVDKREKAQMDYLYRNKTNLASIFKRVNLKEGQNEKDDNSFLYSPQKIDEIRLMAENYRIYLRVRNLSTNSFTRFLSVLNKKHESISDIKHLTTENIERCCLEYVNYCKENRFEKESCRSAINSFLSVLAEIKQVFGQKKSLIGVTYDLPYDERYLIDNKTGVPEHQTVYGRIKGEFTGIDSSEGTTSTTASEVAAAISSDDNDVNNESDELSEGLSETSGTFKTDIVLADKIVRAIYQYEPKAPKDTPEYYHEYQYTTMLRVMADAGTRSEEVINMPNNTLTYHAEHDVNIVILGLSKLGDRFGVVPIGKETAKMIDECTKMRMALFPDSKIMMKMTGDKGYLEEKYVRQFIRVDKRNGAIHGVSKDVLENHLDKICEEAGITRPPKTRFHFMRHRAAEYFFFGMSEYEFEHSDDPEYKLEVIKRLLRHHDEEMTKDYTWSRLLDLLAEKNLVFLRDMKSLKDYHPNKKVEELEKRTLIESLEKRIQKDLETKLSTPGIHRVQLFLSSPLSSLPEEAFEAMNSTQDVSKIINFFREVDGEKSEGTFAVSGAFFGRCVNPTCWRHKEKITCISCFDHLIEERDEPRLLQEIVNCHIRTQEIYQNYDDNMHKEQLRSLQSRISICIEKMNTWLGISETEIVQKVQKRLHETVTEAEYSFKAFIKDLEKMKLAFPA